MATPLTVRLAPAYLSRLYDSVNRNPFVRHIGMELVSIAEDASAVHLVIREHHLQPFGIVHGGVLSTLIDTATFWAGFARLPADAGLVNVDLKLNYLEPARSGRLVAEGRCLRPGRSLSYAEASVRDEGGRLIAHGTSTLMTQPGKGLSIDIPKFVV